MEAPACSFSVYKSQESSLTKNESLAIISEKDLSKDQKVVYDSMMSFYKSKTKKLLTVSGFAGTGKSTVLSCFAKKIESRVAFCAFTGKASSVLRAKLIERGVAFEYCGTIHGLIYIPIIEKTRIRGWRRRSNLDYDLIVIDEGSMVGQKIWRDLQAYNKPILVVGDHGQLPPIGSSINLMENPMIKLEKIHRQAEDNPIIKLSAMIRNDEDYQGYNFKDDRVTFIDKNDTDALKSFIQKAYVDSPVGSLDSVILTYYNRSRVRFNKAIRNMLDYGEELENGDVVICLKNWNYEDGSIFNGMRGIVDKVYGNNSIDTYTAKVDFVDDAISIDADVSAYQFNKETTFTAPEDASRFTKRQIDSWVNLGLLFDYGYALTCHKAQGSQFKDVLVYVEKSKYMNENDFRRWIYTSVTRSSERLVVAS